MNLRVLSVEPSEPEPELTLADLARLSACIARLKRLVNDPVALMARAQALLAGSAEAILSVPIAIGGFKLLAFLLVAGAAACDWPGPVDDWARFALASNWVRCPRIAEL